MSLRIGLDIDGVLADFESAYYAVEDRLFGKAESPSRAGDPEDERTDEQPVEETADAANRANAEQPSQARQSKELRRRRDAVWHTIRNTPDFWLSLDPLDPHAVRRIHRLMLRHRWEVFFITQRPSTLGETVQRQTQRWLVEQGFDLPSVLVIPESRGAATAALELNYHVDDSPKNCIDVISESKAKPILIVEDDDKATAASASRLAIATAASISEALDQLEEASAASPGLLNRLATLAGLR